MKKPIFLLKPNLRTYTKKFYDGWTKKDFEEERLKIAMNISTLSRAQRKFVINAFKYDTKNKNDKAPDNTNK
jgi:hypothetical protein